MPLLLSLLEKETLNREEIERIFEPLKRRPGRPAWTGSARRSPSDRPPVDVPPLANTNAFGPKAVAEELQLKLLKQKKLSQQLPNQ
jgi:cell division protease FtsH